MISCYLCGSEKYGIRKSSIRDSSSLKVLECLNCGLVYLSSRDHISMTHYEQSGMHGKDLPEINEWLTEADEDDNRRLLYLLDFIRGKQLMDFGCGAGGFLLKARDYLKFGCGVEPELRLQEHYNQVGLTVHTNLEQALSANEKYDVITAFHVVEHLPDPRHVLQQLSELLTEDGSIIIELPSSDDALLTQYNCQAFMDHTYWSQHLFLFNRNTIATLVSQAGLKLLWIKGIQRYPLSNHLYWLASGNPGGHIKWFFMNSKELNTAYENQLSALGLCDTIMVGVGIDKKRDIE